MPVIERPVIQSPTSITFDMMTRLYLLLLPVICLLGCAQSQPQTAVSVAAPKPAPGVLFVATNGNDQWSGRLPAPDRKGTDGPFATLPGALKAIPGLDRKSGRER